MRTSSTVLLPVGGFWSEWKVTSTGPCSVSCGGGVMETVLERTCIGPGPGEKSCQGDQRTTRSDPCNLHMCPGIRACSTERSPWRGGQVYGHFASLLLVASSTNCDRTAKLVEVYIKYSLCGHYLNIIIIIDVISNQ